MNEPNYSLKSEGVPEVRESMDQEKGSGIIGIVVGRELIDVVLSPASQQPDGLMVEKTEIERVGRRCRRWDTDLLFDLYSCVDSSGAETITTTVLVAVYPMEESRWVGGSLSAPHQPSE
jgi:hypothetical protein